MDQQILCPKCQALIKSTDSYCSNCGYRLINQPLSTSSPEQFKLILKTVLLPPFGIYWGLKYVHQTDQVSKRLGYLVIGITIVEIIWLTYSTISIMNSMNSLLNNQMQNYGF